MNNYIVTSVEPGKMVGGNKAKNDVVHFLTLNDNFKSLNIIEKKGRLNKLIYAKTALKKLVKQSNNGVDNFILQYPVASEFIEDSFIKLVRNREQARLFILIHDISSLQYPDVVGENFQSRELDRFNKADGLIVHNERMKQWLVGHGVNVPMVSLQIFDYQTDDHMQKEIPFERTVSYAGALGRATFLHSLNTKHTIHIMGPNRLANYPSCVQYDGQFVPSELNQHLLQNFGLVWSGDSIHSCTGHLGEYLKYNDPHKASLYLSNGIPIIIWEKAALAAFIKENNLGIVIDDLDKLDQVMDEISKEDYQVMKANARKVGQKIRNGHFISKAVDSLIKPTGEVINHD